MRHLAVALINKGKLLYASIACNKKNHYGDFPQSAFLSTDTPNSYLLNKLKIKEIWFSF